SFVLHAQHGSPTNKRLRIRRNQTTRLRRPNRIRRRFDRIAAATIRIQIGVHQPLAHSSSTLGGTNRVHDAHPCIRSLIRPPRSWLLKAVHASPRRQPQPPSTDGPCRADPCASPQPPS